MKKINSTKLKSTKTNNNNMKNSKRRVRPVLLKGASLEEQNSFIQDVLKANGVKANIQFEPAVLQTYIDQEKTFGKGLIAYLYFLEKQLDSAIIDAKKLKLYIFQILSELGSLVFPNTSACYSLVPNDLKKLDWESIIARLNQKLKERF